MLPDAPPPLQRETTPNSAGDRLAAGTGGGTRVSCSPRVKVLRSSAIYVDVLREVQRDAVDRLAICSGQTTMPDTAP